jgi:hypothetical protein
MSRNSQKPNGTRVSARRDTLRDARRQLIIDAARRVFEREHPSPEPPSFFCSQGFQQDLDEVWLSPWLTRTRLTSHCCYDITTLHENSQDIGALRGVIDLGECSSAYRAGRVPDGDFNGASGRPSIRKPDGKLLFVVRKC